MSTFIAIESGATRSTAGLYDAETGVLVRETSGEAANPIEHGVARAAGVLASLIKDLCIDKEDCATLIAGVAGAGKGDLANQLANSLSQATGIAEVTVTNDIAPVFHANIPKGPGILVIAGTGSSVMARNEAGDVSVIGGHGALIGDRGSGYRLGLGALEACAAAVDGTGDSTALLQALLGETESNDIDGLVVWASGATKSDIAALAEIVVEHAGDQDDVAAQLVADQASFLADQTSMARHTNDLDDDVPILLYGGLLIGSEVFTTVYREALKNLWPNSDPQIATTTGHAAVAQLFNNPISNCAVANREFASPLPATEQMDNAPKPLDTMSALEITQWMSESESAVQRALHGAQESIASAIERAARAYQDGGRVIYLGAGTSGRLGVLDASECPPTFGVSSDRFVGIIAGGDKALRNSIEGAEDNRDQAVEDLMSLSPFPSKADFVVGITASGTTPYVLSALEYAASLNAGTALIACNPVTCDAADIHIILETGPEVLPGSTRLKAGTATKLALNQITTGAMARCGHIYEGRMVGVKAVNDKLQTRTIRVAADLLNLAEAQAADALDNADGDIKIAVLMHRNGLSKSEAIDALIKSGGHLRHALED